MPYSDKSKKTLWDATHRAERTERFIKAARWADAQIEVLDRISPRAESRADLRKALIAQYLLDHYGTGLDRPKYTDPETLS